MTRSWTSTELAYLAGIIDGEGSFSLKRRRDQSGMWPSQLCVGNTDMRLMDWLKSHFGGNFSIETRPNPKHKPVGRWTASAKDIAPIVQAVLPYLVIKKSQAELILAYRRTVPAVRTEWKTAPAVTAERTRIHSALSVLNRRGVA